MNIKNTARERHDVFTAEINKIALSSTDDQKMQSIDSIEAYVFGTSKYPVSKKEENNSNNIIKRRKNDGLCQYYKRKHKIT